VWPSRRGSSRSNFHLFLKLPLCSDANLIYISDLILQAVMNGHAVHETMHGYEYSGQLIQPTGFEGLLTVIQFQNLSRNLDFEGTSRAACHLVSMKVT
jgi:hypothetical protein